MKWLTDNRDYRTDTDRGGSRTRAVSPVIAVILMVAIVVILSSVLAVFVLGFGVTQPGPTVDFEYRYDRANTALLIHHVEGDPFQSDQVTFVWDDNEVTWTDMIKYLNVRVSIGDGGWLGDVGARSGGDGEPAGLSVDPDDTITIRWESDDGETSTVLDTWEGPDAS